MNVIKDTTKLIKSNHIAYDDVTAVGWARFSWTFVEALPGYSCEL